MDIEKARDIKLTKISSLSESATVSPPLTPAQRVDLAAIRKSLRDMRNEVQDWMAVSDLLYRSLREITGSPHLRLEASMMSLPIDMDILDDILDRTRNAIDAYEAKLISK